MQQKVTVALEVASDWGQFRSEWIIRPLRHLLFHRLRIPTVILQDFPSNNQ